MCSIIIRLRFDARFKCLLIVGEVNSYGRQRMDDGWISAVYNPPCWFRKSGVAIYHNILVHRHRQPVTNTVLVALFISFGLWQ